jgi:hypothetical protein
MGKNLFIFISASPGRDPHILAKHSSSDELENEEKIKLKGGHHVLLYKFLSTRLCY